MKSLSILALAIISASALTGCVPITYQKTVVVHKDGNGKITEIIETESIIEPHTEMQRIKQLDSTTFQNLK